MFTAVCGFVVDVRRDRGFARADGSAAAHWTGARLEWGTEASCGPFRVHRWGFLILMLLWATMGAGMGWGGWNVLGQQLTPEMEFTTGTGAVLQRSVAEITVLPGLNAAALRFELEFGSTESGVLGEPMDAATISLRNANRSYVAALITVDGLGPILLPTTPGGQSMDPADLVMARAVGGVEFARGFDFQFHERYSVILELPQRFLREPASLVLSLFDNQNLAGSRVALRSYRVVPSLRLPVVLESSASVVGPFARENGVTVDRAARHVLVPKPMRARFFRLEGMTSSRIRQLSRLGDGWRLEYEAELGVPDLKLEGSNDGVSFERVTNATLDLATRRFRFPVFRSFRDFRIVGSHPARIVGDEVSGEQRLLTFEVVAVLPRVLSSAQPEGPFALETGVVGDPFLRRLDLPGESVTRYFRLSGGAGLQVVRLESVGEHWRIEYEEP